MIRKLWAWLRAGFGWVGDKTTGRLVRPYVRRTARTRIAELERLQIRLRDAGMPATAERLTARIEVWERRYRDAGGLP